MSSSDEDEDYVPEGVEEQDDVATSKRADAANAANASSVKGDPRVSKIWDDMNASTSVSSKSSAKSAKLLSSLLSGKPRKQMKKRKLREFEMTVLSVDTTKTRKDIAAATSKDEVKEVVKFAGVEYSVSKRVAPAAKSQKLDQVLASLDGPKKVSTMEKTSIDWDKFKEKEGIEDELTQYTKDGYIEKQEFLQRLDHKRFEIEKAERDRVRRMQQQAAPPQ